MPTEQAINIDEAIANFRKDGCAILPGYLTDTPELLNIHKAVHNLASLRAKHNNLAIPKNSKEALNKTIIELMNHNDKNIAFLNDTLNNSAELYAMLNCPAIQKIARTFFQDDETLLCMNNHRIRIQAPGRDEVANLPWHQDSHYNNFYLKNNSVVIWISVYDVTEELGPVVFKKGSQVLNQLEKVDYVYPGGRTVFTIDDKYVNDDRYEEVSYTTKAGDVVLIDMDVLHRSGHNTSTDQVKFGCQVRYHNASTKGFLPHYGITS